MGEQKRTRERETDDPIFTAVGNGRRRSILGLLSRTPELSEQELARAVTAREHGASEEDVATEAVESTRMDLFHIQLPVLEDTDFVTWDGNEGPITTTDHIALEDPRFQQLLQTTVEGIDDVLFELADSRQRLILAILRDRASPMTRTALAREVVRRENGGTDPTRAAVDEVVISLHHVQLPNLSNTGIIEYDVGTGYATYTGHPGVEEIVTILQEPDSRLIARLDTFFQGLETSYSRAGESMSDPFSSPGIWRTPYHE